jgi:CRP/FNR family transcriptional regulator, cyclic AMP receptor protein
MLPIDSASPWLKVDLETWSVFAGPQYLASYPAGAVICAQGQDEGYVYVVKSGRVMLRAADSEGREIILMFAERGGLFGETGLFASTSQPYSAVAIVGCELYKVPKAAFLEKLEKDATLNRAVMTVLAHKVNLHIHQVLGLSFGDVRYRIAGVFIYLTGMYGVNTPEGTLIDLPFTHQDMADLVKSSRVTVSKVLHAFQQGGVISKRKGRYTVQDIKRLEDIVQAEK